MSDTRPDTGIDVAAALRQVREDDISLLTAYMEECEATGRKFAKGDSYMSDRMWWRADGAVAALKDCIEALRARGPMRQGAVADAGRIALHECEETP